VKASNFRLFKIEDIESNTIEVKFSGNGITPSNLTPSEMAELLISFEKAIISVVEENYPEIDFMGESHLRFDDIGHRSLSLRSLIIDYQDYYKEGFLTIVNSVNSSEDDDLPKEVSTFLRKVNRVTDIYDCEANLGYSTINNKFKSLAKIIDLCKKEPVKRFKIEKSLHGILSKVITEPTPKIYIRLHNGSSIGMTVSKDQIKQFRQYCDEQVKINGIATFTSDSFRITSFELKSLAPFELLSPIETSFFLKKLANKKNE